LADFRLRAFARSLKSEPLEEPPKIITVLSLKESNAAIAELGVVAILSS